MNATPVSARRTPCRITVRLLSLFMLLPLVAFSRDKAPVSCESLSALTLPDTAITQATTVTPPAMVGGFPVTVPFCRVTATLTPTSDSNIRIEIWLPPVESWNRKYLGTGNGGYAGAIAYPLLADGVRRGYATANTDMGTSPAISINADALVGHPEKWVDWGHRATHLMTARSKEIVQAYYDKRPKYSYFSGCSTGGQQGLMEAQRYPDDYDGIISGAPANDRTHLHTATIWNFAATHPVPTSPVPLLTPAKLALVNSAVLASCAAHGGGLATDPFLSDPRDCHFDPGTLQCAGADAPNCLTADQVRAMRLYYAGPRNPRTGEQIVPGPSRGGELNNFGLLLQQALPEPAFGSLFKWHFGPTWSWRTFDFDQDLVSLDTAFGGFLNATDTDLRRFKRGGSKLIMFQGWADPLLPAQLTVDYYEKVAADHGSLHNTKKFARLFMAPGLGHCGGGAGPNMFGGPGHFPAPQVDAEHDMLMALERWVETGDAPEKIVATKYVGDNPANGVAMQRPMCAYPKQARYVGAGDTNDAANFVCVRDERGAQSD